MAAAFRFDGVARNDVLRARSSAQFSRASSGSMLLSSSAASSSPSSSSSSSSSSGLHQEFQERREVAVGAISSSAFEDRQRPVMNRTNEALFSLQRVVLFSRWVMAGYSATERELKVDPSSIRLRDVDFASGQQFSSAHFTHIHAYRVSRTTIPDSTLDRTCAAASSASSSVLVVFSASSRSSAYQALLPLPEYPCR